MSALAYSADLPAFAYKPDYAPGGFSQAYKFGGGLQAPGTGRAVAAAPVFAKRDDVVEFHRFHDTHHGAEPVAKSWTSKSPGGDIFPELLARALRARLAPNTGIHRKVLCEAVRCHRHTLDSLIAGTTQNPNAAVVFNLVQFFGDQFLAEIFPRVASLRAERERRRA